MPSLLIEYRNVYGSPKAYPMNLIAEQFADLIGTKTFNEKQLAAIAQLGFDVQKYDRVRVAA